MSNFDLSKINCRKNKLIKYEIIIGIPKFTHF